MSRVIFWPGRAMGGARLVGRAVVQLNVDKMIVGVDALFHGNEPFFIAGPFRRVAGRPGL